MVSRRTVVAGGGALATLGLGWVVSGGLAHSGEVVRKQIGVSWEYDGGEPWNGSLLRSQLGPDGEIDLWYDPSYVGSAVSGPRAISVDDSLHERLRNEFREVEYRLGVCGTAEGEGCPYRMKRTTRAGFNRVQLGDEAAVTDPNARLFVHDTEPATDWSGTADVAEFDFDRRHADRGR